MPPHETEYRFPFTDEDYLRVAFTLDRGMVVAFVVQCEIIIDGRAHAVVRYDTAHGEPHRDTIGWGGDVLHKEWLEHSNRNEAMTYAQNDLRENWRGYRAAFLERRPG